MKKRIGASLLLLLGVAVFPALAAKKKAAPEQYVVLYGTVFRDTGFALPDADVTVVPDPAADTSVTKVKKMQAVSNGRGEFAFHLPVANLRYIVKVSAKGYRSLEKPVTVEGQDRIDVTFQLQPESNK